jgi:hypothetical protein
LGGAAEIRSTDNSPTKTSQDPAWITKGTVTNIDLRNYTVDVVGEYEGDFWEKLQIATPYFHTANGEGIFAMPEVGSICLICQPSDDKTPYILGFIGSFELEHAKTANLEDRAGEAKNEEEETKASVKTPTSTTSSGSTTQTTSGASARAGRPFLNPGDIMMQTRDQNFLVLRRGGVVQIGATPGCQSIYVPLLNHMRHFAENYDVTTPGGVLSWVVKRVENDPGGKAPVLYRLALRDKAQNDKADIQIRMGHVDDDIRYELLVSPEKIKVEDGSDTGTPKLKMTINKDGDQEFEMKGDLIYDIAGKREIDITGNDTLNVTGIRDVTALSIGHTAKLDTTVKSAARTETYTGFRTINALLHMLGPAPMEPAVLGGMLATWLATHRHEGPGAPTKTADAQKLATIFSTRLLIPK